MKILIADDDRTIHTSLSKPFTTKGFEVINAYDGQEALDMALKEKPDIIFLDVTMPRLDGRDVCKKIRDTPGSENMNIIMLTAKNQQFEDLTGCSVLKLVLTNTLQSRAILIICSEPLKRCRKKHNGKKESSWH